MELGGGTSTKSTDLDATLPTAPQQEEFNDEYEDVEDGRNEATAHYTNAPALGLTTLEMACGGSETELPRASRHNLDTVNSAGQSEVDQLHKSSCGEQRRSSLWGSGPDFSSNSDRLRWQRIRQLEMQLEDEKRQLQLPRHISLTPQYRQPAI